MLPVCVHVWYLAILTSAAHIICRYFFAPTLWLWCFFSGVWRWRLIKNKIFCLEQICPTISLGICTKRNFACFSVSRNDTKRNFAFSSVSHNDMIQNFAGFLLHPKSREKPSVSHCFVISWNKILSEKKTLDRMCPSPARSKLCSFSAGCPWISKGTKCIWKSNGKIFTFKNGVVLVRTRKYYFAPFCQAFWRSAFICTVQ